jgi:hypothetical protein
MSRACPAQKYTMYMMMLLITIGAFSLLLLAAGILAVKDEFDTLNLAKSWLLMVALLCIILEMPTAFIIGTFLTSSG